MRRAPDQPVGSRFKRIAIVAAMGVVTLNIWTGAPLLGLWVGSRVAPESGISMGAVLVIIVVIGVGGVAAHAGARLPPGRVRGGPRPPRGPAPDDVAAPDERRAHARQGHRAPPLTSVDYVVIGVVVLAIAAFEVWFFFFAGSSLRSG